MAVYQDMFVVARIGDLHGLFLGAIRQAEANAAIYRKVSKASLAAAGLGNAEATRRELQRAYALFNRELDDLARASAADATAKIIEQLKLTQKRPDTGHKPGLAKVIRSRPVRLYRGLATGAVGVADEAWLDRAVNPLGPQYGPYWKAQEFGTTAHVGRVIRGYFADAGGSNLEPPKGIYSGGGGPHPIFVPGRAGNLPGSVQGGVGPRGGRGGYGTIRHPLRARHFIEKGAVRAMADYVVGVKAIEARVLARLAAV